MKWPFYYSTCISFADVLEHVNKKLLIFKIQFMSQSWETGTFEYAQMWTFRARSSGRFSWTSLHCISTKIVVRLETIHYTGTPGPGVPLFKILMQINTPSHAFCGIYCRRYKLTVFDSNWNVTPCVTQSRAHYES